VQAINMIWFDREDPSVTLLSLRNATCTMVLKG